jgi:two-component system LytT family response regulator
VEANTTRTISALVIDDEAPARVSLRTRLLAEADVWVVGEAIDGPSAVAAIRTAKPDLVFLDIQMPGHDGFEVLRRVGAAHLPAVIFVTAYDHYAFRAFQLHVIDYLVKPVIPSRLHSALQNLRDGFDKEEALVERQTNLLNALYSDATRTTAFNGPARGPRALPSSMRRIS